MWYCTYSPSMTSCRSRSMYFELDLALCDIVHTHPGWHAVDLDLFDMLYIYFELDLTLCDIVHTHPGWHAVDLCNMLYLQPDLALCDMVYTHPVWQAVHLDLALCGIVYCEFTHPVWVAVFHCVVSVVLRLSAGLCSCCGPAPLSSRETYPRPVNTPQHG